MTDNRTTELREKLDELGIEHFDYDKGGRTQTMWQGSDGFRHFTYETAANPAKTARLVIEWFPTPDQAIAATLGSETANIDDVLALLDSIREAGRISYDDYSQLFDAIAELGSELNPDGLPVGLTISDDGNLLDWRGENYVKQSTLCGGKLTAEQVRKAIRKYAHDDSCYIFEVYGEMCGPIADELNAELGSGTCDPVETEAITYYDEYGHDAVKVHFMECDRCGGTYEHVNGAYERCPRCGKAVG